LKSGVTNKHIVACLKSNILAPRKIMGLAMPLCNVQFF